MTDLANQASQAEPLIQFHKALQSQSPALLRKALKAGLDPNTQEDVGRPGERLHYRIHLIELLMDCHTHPGKEMMEMLDLLLNAGSDPRLAISRDGETALMKALGSSRAPIARKLIEAGDDVHAVAPRGISVLHKACLSNLTNNDAEMLELLAQHGVNLRVNPDEYGRTPLMLLACDKPEAAFWMLQRVPESVNAQDGEGETALMYAIAHKSISCVRLLLGHGADATMCNHKGLDALAYAHAYKSQNKTMLTEHSMIELDQVIDYLSLYTRANQARNMISNIAARSHAVAQGSAP